VMMLIPDTAQGTVYRTEIEPNLAAGDMLMFAHGFNIRFGTIKVRPDVDVAMLRRNRPATGSASSSSKAPAPRPSLRCIRTRRARRAR